MIWLPFPPHRLLNLLSHILLQDQHMAQSIKEPCVSSGGVETCCGWLQLSALAAKALPAGQRQELPERWLSAWWNGAP